MSAIDVRVDSFCRRFGLELPILLAPMAGASAPALSIAVMQAGGLGACGALLMQPDEIAAWADEVRAKRNGPYQLNLWVPDPPPRRDAGQEQLVRAFLSDWGPPPAEDAGDARPPDFAAQCEALLAAGPPIVSSVMGVFPSEFVARLRRAGIAWFANVSTVAEAQAAEAAGADVIVAQGMEAGGHRGCFDASQAERRLVGSFALIPAVADAVEVPVVATGGIGDARGVAAALVLGASAVQIGSAFLRCPEAGVHPAWAEALACVAPEDTIVTSVFSGRAGRSVATAYALAAIADEAPPPAPYPVQRGLTAAMRTQAAETGDVQRMQAWAGQSARLGRAEPASQLGRRTWDEALALLKENHSEASRPERKDT
jgi:nitronate monooxygenase